MTNPTYIVRNASDNSIIEFSTNLRHANETARQVRSGDFDNNPRECWVQDEEHDDECEYLYDGPGGIQDREDFHSDG